LHWDGSQWSNVHVPTPNLRENDTFLNGVSAVGPSDMWVVGQAERQDESPRDDTLAEHWNGGHWTIVATPSPGQGLLGGDNDLLAVATVATDDVWTVGWYSNDGGGGEIPLAEHWDGTRWSQATIPEPVHASSGHLTAVSAVSASDVWAVGTVIDSRLGHSIPLIEHYDGHRWRIVTDGRAQTGQGTLNGLDALSADDVWATGNMGKGSFSEHWDGAQWSRFALPHLAGGTMTAVAAAGPSDVWAVGGKQVQPLDETESLLDHWNGTSWTAYRPAG
jgi:hypothetical protein